MKTVKTPPIGEDLCKAAVERLRANDDEGAMGLLEETIAHYPNSALARYHLGSVLKRSGKPEQSLAQFEEVKRILKSRGNGDGRFMLGGAYFHSAECKLAMGQRDLAFRDFKKCLTLAPEHKKAAEHIRSLTPEVQPERAVADAKNSLTGEYQRFVIDGKEICSGQLDTLKKFEQMTQGIDLTDKRVLDIGCRRGAMCYYAWRAGAAGALGLDLHREIRKEAERIKEEYYPEAPVFFDVCRASRISGQYDVILASALFHWLEDADIALRQIARVLEPDGVFSLDVWVTDSAKDSPPTYTPRPGHAGRIHWIPNQRAVRLHLSQFFEKIQFGGIAVAPNDTNRRLIQCRGPKSFPTQAMLIFGDPGAGKTTMAFGLEYGRGFNRLSLDDVFHTWYFHAPKDVRDNGRLKEASFKPYELEAVESWASALRNTDIVIEGGRIRDRYNQRDKVVAILQKLGWENILEVRL